MSQTSLWHIVITPPQKELIAKRILEEMGHEVRVPRGRKRISSRHGKKRWRWQDVTLLKRYVFVKFDGPLATVSREIVRPQSGGVWRRGSRVHVEQACCGFADFPCIQRIMIYGGKPVALHDEDIAHLIALADDDAGQGEYKAVAFRAGQRVRVTEGPFFGLPATFIRFTRRVAVIDVDIFGRSTRLSIDPAALEAA